ncbi:NAD(P)-dependent alcohol dehydrogenase [Cellulosimicrobium protaetiae]|uniref:NAD(P)-dependent alcohol dehydrogenase n=1 Tax=Cellulosimicrobium protaetiae TaxID=2587808 RepID=A0A6M5UIU7_9MICO|nr:NAD(P)-dependent alcohol dehydrogenase [Cellulosimicrobium protaetiae]QJW37153.1 NAD(P)-dependent alcohol dehydrogenase [Cellulosimicrobium protaetiae]
MRAAVVDRYGPPDVVRVAEIAPPRVGTHDVLVRVHATAVTAADARIRGARFPRGFGAFARLAFGVRRPRHAVLGGVFSGVVEEVGAAVEGVAPGDAVSGMTGSRMGAHAELLAVPATRAVARPDGASHDDAAAVLFGGTTAWHFLRRRATVTSGTSVLVVGAGGAVGSNAVQLAGHLGATVTAVTSTPNLDLVARLGADHVVDRTTAGAGWPDRLGERYDVVLDAVGALSPATGRPLLTDAGVLLLVAADLGQTLAARGAVRAGPAPEHADDVAHLLGLVAEGTLTPVIESVHDLDGIRDAYVRVDSGHKVGNIVVHP